jgi:hypothetical protein
MKICLVGPGIMPIPPNGWGAVEMLIWDYYNVLTSLGHEVEIINTPNKVEILQKIKDEDFDVVHVHYDVFSDIMSSIECKVKILSSHYPFISYPERYNYDGYNNQIGNIVNNSDFTIFASSQNDIDTFCKFGAIRENTFLSRLGVKHDSYDFSENSVYDKTICFSQIVDRKRQYLIQDLDNIDFFGRKDDKNFTNLNNYKGELDRDLLNKEITKYANFILLSSVENTTPLVVKEALICGLGVVVTDPVALELDKELDFITIIEEDKVSDLSYIKSKIEENKKISTSKRGEIREYGIRNFGIENILKNEYMKKIESIL